MWKPEEPNGRFGRWGQVASAVATFGFLAFVIVFVILDWIVGAAPWVLWAACIPIAAFSIAWGFAVVEDDELEPEAIADAERRSDRSKITWMEPKGKFGRWGQLGGMLLGILMVLWAIGWISELVGMPAREWDLWVRRTVFLSVVLFAFLMEMTTLGEDEEDDRAGLPDLAPVRDSANAKFHERDSKA